MRASQLARAREISVFPSLKTLYALQFLLFGSLFAVLGLCSLTFYGLLAETIATLLKRNTRFQRIQRYVTGSIYVALGLTAAFAGSEKK
jgi:threonine/homoserine/homoserine lactone efflux protein